MATFKVGDRVRVIANHGFGPEGSKFIGREGVVVFADSRWGGKFAYQLDCGENWWFAADELAPAVDDSEWAKESVSNLIRICKTEPLPLEV